MLVSWQQRFYVHLAGASLIFFQESFGRRRMVQTCVDICNKKVLKDYQIYDEVTEDIFGMSYVRIFIEIEKKKIGDVYTLLHVCLRSAELR